MNGEPPVAVPEADRRDRASGKPPAYVFNPYSPVFKLYSPEITEKFHHGVVICAAHSAMRNYAETKVWSIRAAKAFT